MIGLQRPHLKRVSRHIGNASRSRKGRSNRREQRQASPARGAANVRAIGTRTATSWGIDDDVDSAHLDQLDRVGQIDPSVTRRRSHTHLCGDAGYLDASLSKRCSGSGSRDNFETELSVCLRSGEPRLLVTISNAKEHSAARRKIATCGNLTLGKRKAWFEIDAHDLAGAAHLGAEELIGLGETGEWQDGLFDRTRVAIFTNGRPVAFATNGTVRDARGLASSTKTLRLPSASLVTAYCTLSRPWTSSSSASAAV
jgi:hypothetical protein